MPLFGRAEQQAATSLTWPQPERFPHNEDGQKVWDILSTDLIPAQSILVIVGYASLLQVVELLAKRTLGLGHSTRIFFGNEPFPIGAKTRLPEGPGLADEIRDYWLRESISPMKSAAVIHVIDAIEKNLIEVRTSPRNHSHHPKIYLTETAVTVGSSNFTPHGIGLKRQSEGNERFVRTEEPERYEDARLYAENVWVRAVPYKSEFLRLLRQLLRPVSWQEALARACAAILEGWERKYIAAGELSRLDPRLWPHQLQGLSQAMWILENVGNVLVADAAGSGKTRTGSWILRAAYDRQLARGAPRPPHPLIVAPPAVLTTWKNYLHEARLYWPVYSHGALSNKSASERTLLLKSIRDVELLALDEAHNYVNASFRTNLLLSHHAEQVVLFTATPISKSTNDLLRLVELLGADHLSGQALRAFKRLRKHGRELAHRELTEALAVIRAELRKFLVRRTRSELNRIAYEREAEYRSPSGRVARYPDHQAKFYDCPAGATDLELAARIATLIDQLTGIGRLRGELKLPAGLAADDWDEERYLAWLKSSAQALARYAVRDCLRSSRAALFEHIYGTVSAWKKYGTGDHLPQKSATGNMVESLAKWAGQVPKWSLSLPKEHVQVPRWLWDETAHRVTSEQEAALYREIANLVSNLSACREEAKCQHLATLGRDRLVIGFDSHLITLALFERMLKRQGLDVDLFVGRGGSVAKRRAGERLGLSSKETCMVALCSDSLSEGMNLQKASCVVHLDTPTDIRTAEQRAGRVDRMDSPHDTVEVWWPRDPPAFAPRRHDLLAERHKLVSDLIGSNLLLPKEPQADETLSTDETLSVEELAKQADIAHQDERHKELSDLCDAFHPVRHLIGEKGLVPQHVYDQIRTSQADIKAGVDLDLVESAMPWAFFAVGGLERQAPRWVYFDQPDAPPEVDLARVAEALRRRLNDRLDSVKLDEYAQGYIDHFVERLELTEPKLLPLRRQRALNLAERVLGTYLEGLVSEERRRLLGEIIAMLRPDARIAHPEPRAVADAWLRLIRLHEEQAIAGWRRRRGLWKLDRLYEPLLTTPLKDDELREAFTGLPVLPPAGQRIIVTIVGVPRRPS